MSTFKNKSQLVPVILSAENPEGLSLRGFQKWNLVLRPNRIPLILFSVYRNIALIDSSLFTRRIDSASSPAQVS